eukprot:GILK01003627.1.p1 GENE.GILK01003627.1~~GILK01003627.1.p1  ORF type:complete len:673 (-),score=156.53 GILK01003627.1:209-2227(-)
MGGHSLLHSIRRVIMSSSFRDTFTKDEKKDPLLDYDDSAFYYFAATVVLVVAAPLTYSVFKTIFGKRDPVIVKTSHADVIRTCKCSICITKEHRIVKEETSVKRRFGWGFVLRVVLAVCFWASFYLLIQNISGDTAQIRSFDPFFILGIETDASETDIRKAYKKLSLQYHPDKNINDPTAAAKFVLVSKAYQSLTDDVARKNYEKYGNPDGPQAMKVAIGLPRFLLDEENHILILCVFFAFLLIVLPAIALLWYQQSKKYAENGVLLETMQFLFKFLTENTRVKHLPEIFAATAEYRRFVPRPTDNEDMKPLVMELRDVLSKIKFNHPHVVRNNILIHAHLNRMKLTPPLAQDLSAMLKDLPKLVETSIDLCVYNRHMQTIVSIIDFSQMMVQALNASDSSLLQIPHFTEYNIKHCKTGKFAVANLKDFVKAEHRKGLAKLTDEELQDVDAFCAHVPDMNIEYNVAVEDEDEIVEGDVCTVTVKMERLNLRENEEAGPVHAPFFPHLKREIWWVLLGDATGQKLITLAKVKNQGRVVEEKLMFQAPPAGQYQFELFVKCDSYLGLDQRFTVKLNVLAQSQVKREIVIHPEDQALDNEPSMFQQLMNGMNEQDSSDEEEEIDVPRSKNKHNKAHVHGANCNHDHQEADSGSDMEEEIQELEREAEDVEVLPMD